MTDIPKDKTQSFNKDLSTDAPKKITKSFSFDVQDVELSKSMDDENTFTAVATAEIIDAHGDMVLVDGIDLKRYGEDSHLPLLSGHNGDKIAGVITKVYRSQVVFKGEKVKALKIVAKLNDTEDGEYWKKIKKSGLPLRLSIGADVEDYEVIKDKKDRVTGILYKKTVLLETSLASMPANPAAQEISKSKESDINKWMDDMTKEEFEQVMKNLGDKLDKISLAQENITKSLDVHETRLDEIASKVTTSTPKPETSKSQSATDAESQKRIAEDELSKKLADLVEQLRKTNKKS